MSFTNRRSTLLALGIGLTGACTPVVDEPEPVICEGHDDEGGALLVAPYLQSMSPTSVWVLWETEQGAESRVDWGIDAELGSAACGGLVPLNPELPDSSPTRVHEVELTGLEPGTAYHYRATTGGTTSEVVRFRTPDVQGDEGSFRLVAMSDSQRDDSRPDQLAEVVEDGVLRFVRSELGEDLVRELDLVLFAGDLVDNGWYHDEWVDDFFASAAPLLGQVPAYPVPGNHEGNSPHFFRYFHLPDNGTPGFEEHWWQLDHGNVRVIGLDSNEGYRRIEQLTWLQETLDDACAEEAIDFVFAELHHPHRSELWTPGNLDFTGEVIALLESFSTDCDKPSIHFFGHTHAYSRGQSRDHEHLMVNVASAGGALDRWGEQPQEDYAEFSVSQDDYGFVLVEVDAGAAPRFRLRRVSLGTPEAPLDNAVRDDVTVRAENAPPATPSAQSTSNQDDCGADVRLEASEFVDPDGDAQGAAHWQVSADCEDFGAPSVDRWRQRRNEYQGVDTQAGDDLSDEELPELQEAGAWCWRVRHRDEGLVWSAWSEPEPFTTAGCQ